MKQADTNPDKVLHVVLELMEGQEVDVTLAPDTVALITRDVQKALDEIDVSLAEVYEIEMVRPFE
ncbi:MAG: hypothetical protein IPM39_27585 [Chloroflexi bacterium]|nr:hypothetical protein [Chloroflexota bacterium]